MRFSPAIETARSLFKTCGCGWLLVVTCAAAATADDPQPAGAVTISADFAGGNISVDKNEEGVVHVSPDLRGDRPWFYWYFEATANKPGRVRFVFPEKVGGSVKGAIGLQGPAISTDSGKTWQWMGTDPVEETAFFYDFNKAGEQVRFAVTIPYTQANLAAFVEQHAKNPHLKVSVLTKSRKGREVQLLRVGEPGQGKQSVLFTARHHATETIASYVLEGILAAAMADNPTGEAFREKYVLYAVPLVDRDGVEDGDQGKNRKPHDHNRDYGENSIYPEVQAIKDLGQEVNIQYAIDIHCPTLNMKDHQVMYILGAKEHPKYNFENVSIFAERIKNGLPKTAPYGPLNWMTSESEPTPLNSRYFGFREGAVMAFTLEFPFAPPGKKTDPASCRGYGQVMLEAFTFTKFTAESP